MKFRVRRIWRELQDHILDGYLCLIVNLKYAHWGVKKTVRISNQQPSTSSTDPQSENFFVSFPVALKNVQMKL